MITIYCYSRCSTCKNAIKFLENNNKKFISKDIITEHPNKEEMKEIISRSNIDIKKFFNTSGNVYKDLNLKDKLPSLNEDEKISLLVSNGMLMKRPLVVTNDKILLGFKVDEWNKTLL